MACLIGHETVHCSMASHFVALHCSLHSDLSGFRWHYTFRCTISYRLASQNDRLHRMASCRSLQNGMPLFTVQWHPTTLFTAEWHHTFHTVTSHVHLKPTFRHHAGWHHAVHCKMTPDFISVAARCSSQDLITLFTRFLSSLQFRGMMLLLGFRLQEVMTPCSRSGCRFKHARVSVSEEHLSFSLPLHQLPSLGVHFTGLVLKYHSFLRTPPCTHFT